MSKTQMLTMDCDRGQQEMSDDKQLAGAGISMECWYETDRHRMTRYLDI